MRRGSLAAFLSAALLLAACLAATGVRAEEIVVFGNSYKSPKISLEEEKPKGILVDILRWAEAGLGVTFDIRLFPWARAYNSALSGAGGIVGLSLTRERLATFDYSMPVYDDLVIVVVKKGHAFPFTGIDDLRGKTVGIGLGGTFGDDFESARREGLIIVDEDNGPVQRLKKLLLGRIDVALLSPGPFALASSIAQDAMLQDHEAEFEVLATPLKRDPNYLAFPKSMDRRLFLRRFNKVLARGIVNGDIQAIIGRYQ